MRTFDSGATRDTDTNKLDYEGFLSPIVLRRYAEFMHKNRFQKDGKLRDSDNWQKGMPWSVYMKSLWRHFMDLWISHRGYTSPDPNHPGLRLMPPDREEALCAIIFNASGYLHELLRATNQADEFNPLRRYFDDFPPT